MEKSQNESKQGRAHRGWGVEAAYKLPKLGRPVVGIGTLNLLFRHGVYDEKESYEFRRLHWEKNDYVLRCHSACKGHRNT